jgi:hypothetical protein
MDDDIPCLKYVTAKEIQKIIKNHNLMKWDYAVINGTILKTFNNGSFNIKGLK